jgi:dTDP-4-dehydrorhamnose 3,5-epimerase
MVIEPTDLLGVFVVEPELVIDERGSFGRTYCRLEFATRGIEFTPGQSSISHNTRKGTLRGLHYQASPHSESKLVRCTVGAAFDVAADVRPDSPTFGQSVAVELTAENRRALYIPPGVAHGFQTLIDNTELLYLISGSYEPTAERGVRWNDPALAIDWPSDQPTVVSDRDRKLPHLRQA